MQGWHWRSQRRQEGFCWLHLTFASWQASHDFRSRSQEVSTRSLNGDGDSAAGAIMVVRVCTNRPATTPWRTALYAPFPSLDRSIGGRGAERDSGVNGGLHVARRWLDCATAGRGCDVRRLD